MGELKVLREKKENISLNDLNDYNIKEDAKRLEVLREQMDDFYDQLMEKESLLDATRGRIKHYEQALSVKDIKARIYDFMGKSVAVFILGIAGTLSLSAIPFVSELISTNLSLLCKCLVGISCVTSSILCVKKFKEDCKEYNKKGGWYSHLSVPELKEKIASSKVKQRLLEQEIKAEKPTLRYLKEEVAKAITKVNKEKAAFANQISNILENSHTQNEKINYEDIDLHYGMYDIPKVKLKRRDENVTETKGNL